jgi:hypothetical protein
LEASRVGVYAGPLRLLAMEVYDELNRVRSRSGFRDRGEIQG